VRKLTLSIIISTSYYLSVNSSGPEWRVQVVIRITVERASRDFLSSANRPAELKNAKTCSGLPRGLTPTRGSC
jgi:hypothetical protein